MHTYETVDDQVTLENVNQQRKYDTLICDLDRTTQWTIGEDMRRCVAE